MKRRRRKKKKATKKKHMSPRLKQKPGSQPEKDLGKEGGKRRGSGPKLQKTK